MKYPIPKGVFDILPTDPADDGKWRESHLWQYLEETIHQIARSYGFKEIRTPIFEKTELFSRTVGETSDIVTKEMYTFEDRGGRLMTLRPEGTASVMRSFVEKHLHQQGGVHKFYYIGPMFRYERPQAGRFRQFHQLGFEVIGDPTPEQDVEMIDLSCEFYSRLGLKNLNVMINCIGTSKTRENYRDALRDFLKPKFDQLSEESQMRFEKNVLRILDSKNETDQKLLEGAPTIFESLDEEEKEHFQRVQDLLKQLGRTFVINPKLVRGLDYYTKTVFEVTSGELGAQNALGAGGRYDGMTALIGGPDLPAVGFAAGMERIIQTMLAQGCSFPKPPFPLIYFIPLGDAAKKSCFDLVFKLRHLDIPAEMGWQKKKVGASMQIADALDAQFVLVLGDDELVSKKIKLKEMATREEIELDLDNLTTYLQQKINLGVNDSVD